MIMEDPILKDYIIGDIIKEVEANMKDYQKRVKLVL